MTSLPNRITTALLAVGGWSVYVTQPKRKGSWVFVPDAAADAHYAETKNEKTS